MEDFRGKRILITGAGRGIGKRLALGFGARGAQVGLVARSLPELDLTRLEIEHSGGMAITLRADVRDYEQLEEAVNSMRGEAGEIDVLICAAGIQGAIGPVWETLPSSWAQTIETNLIGVLHACRAVLPHMVKRRCGKIVALAGPGAMRSRPNFSAYAAAKAALVRMVETIADETREHNVQVNCLGPGPTYTHMTDEVLRAGEQAGWKESEDAVKIRLTGGAPPGKQMELAAFLASEESNHISGKLLHIEDNWKRLRRGNVHSELYTLRRVRKV